MPGRKLVALVLVFVACASGCGRKPGRGKAIPPARDSGIALPALDGLGLTKVDPLKEADGPAGAEKWLRKVTVDVPVQGSPKVVDARDASQWRGVALPSDEDHRPIPVDLRLPPELRVTMDGSGAIRIDRKVCKDLAEFRKLIGDLQGRLPESDVVLDAGGAAPYGNVLHVIAAVTEQGIRFKFQAPPASDGGVHWWWDGDRERVPPAAELRKRLRQEAENWRRDKDGLPNACVRIRADAAAPWSSVASVMVEAVRAYMWRLSFVGLLDGREVEIGRAFTTPEAGQWSQASLEMIEPPGLGFQEDVITDIPLDGTGEVRELGIGSGGGAGIYGFRTGGGRSRAALRHGGSRASERAVDNALRWLARNQSEDGRWSATRFSGAEGMDLAATGLATLTFLGAGHTEKMGRHRNTVVKAVKWLVKQQTGDGRIGGETVKPGLQHAIAALALAEAYGMARVPTTGVAAQKAVDYTMSAQVEYSGWGFERKAKPNMLVTGWTIAQLKSSLIAGLRVDGKGFQYASAFIDVCVKRRGWSYRRTTEASPAMTAMATSSKQIMGWRRDDPRLVGGADFLAGNLPEWKEGHNDLHYWYWGTLVMFQMGLDWWKQWNANVRDMLVERQRRGLPDIDGSWDPMGGLLKDTGRGGSTAMAAMCLEVYYR